MWVTKDSANKITLFKNKPQLLEFSDKSYLYIASTKEDNEFYNLTNPLCKPDILSELFLNSDCVEIGILSILELSALKIRLKEEFKALGDASDEPLLKRKKESHP